MTLSVLEVFVRWSVIFGSLYLFCSWMVKVRKKGGDDDMSED